MLYEHCNKLYELAEPSFAEYQTAAYVRKTLKELDIPYHVIGTSTIALLPGHMPSWIGYRCDCDGILVDGKTQHKCGHNAHMALALELLAYAKKHPLRHNLMVLFQAAEERVAGAEILLPYLAKYPLACMIGLHILPFVKKGAWYTKEGTFFVGSQEIDLVFEGKGGHAALPEQCDDLILDACFAVTKIQSYMARKFRKHVVSFGNIHVQGIRNVLPDRVVVEGTVRIFANEDRQAVLTLIESLLPKQAHVEYGCGVQAIDNDAHLLSLFPHSYETAKTIGFADDFGVYGKLCPILYLGFGGAEGMLHHESFQLDLPSLEQALLDLQSFLVVLDREMG